MIDILKIYDKTITFISIDKSGTILNKIEIEYFYIYYEDIKNIFPPNFNPQIIYFLFPEYYFIPVNLETSNALTIALVSDWNLNFINLKENVKVFDYIFTDKKGVSVFKNYGFNNVMYFPLFGLQSESYKNFITKDKKYDICFIGNLNDNIQIKRAEYLYKIALLEYKYNVIITSGIYGDEYKQLLCQSKIIFNLSIRGELNIRVFEAMNAKSLLLLEEDNLEYNLFFQPDTHFVSYNENNLYEKIDYFLKHEDERNKITNNAYEFIKVHTKEWFEASLFQEFIKLLRNPPKNIFQNNYINLLRGGLNTINKNILNLIWDKSQREIKNAESANIYLSAKYINYQKLSVEKDFEDYINIYPDYVPLKINLLKIYFKNNNIEQSLLLLNKIIEILENNILVIENLKGFIIDEKFSRFSVEYEKAYAENDLQAVKKAFLWLVYKMAADIHSETKLKILYLEKADNIFNSVETKLKLGDINSDINLEKSFGYYHQALKINPFNLELIYKLDSISEFLDKPFEDREWFTIIDSSPILKQLENTINNYHDKNQAHKISLINKYIDNQQIVEHLFSKLSYYDSNKYDEIMLLANIYLQQKEYKKALNLLIKSIKIKQKKEPSTISLIIECLENLGDFDTIKKLKL